jgi:hypothetical protein
MSRVLRNRAKRNGTQSKYAGDEPRGDELTAHLPKPKIKHRRFAPPTKRTMKRRRKVRINKHADAAAYQARVTAPWSLYVAAKEGGQTK